jgi:hypothetical protein
MLLKLNPAQVQVLSEALVQYLEGAAGQGIAGGNVTLGGASAGAPERLHGGPGPAGG